MLFFHRADTHRETSHPRERSERVRDPACVCVTTVDADGDGNGDTNNVSSFHDSPAINVPAAIILPLLWHVDRSH